MPTTNITHTIIQKTFGSKHFATDDFRRTQQFYELILIDTKSVIITHTPNKFNPGQYLCSKNILNTQQWKNPFEERKFSITFILPHLITMTIKMPGIELFYIIQTFTHGSSIFTTLLQIHFRFGFIIGGCGLDASQMPFPPRPKKDGNIWSKPQQQRSPT